MGINYWGAQARPPSRKKLWESHILSRRSDHKVIPTKELSAPITNHLRCLYPQLFQPGDFASQTRDSAYFLHCALMDVNGARGALRLVRSETSKTQCPQARRILEGRGITMGGHQGIRGLPPRFDRRAPTGGAARK